MSGLDIHDLRELVVEPALRAIGYWSREAEALVLGTACHESGLVDLRQRGGGPALGLWQLETATHNDLWRNWLAFRPPLAGKMRSLLPLIEASKEIPAAETVTWNLRYGAAMARCQYLRAPEAIPAVDDVDGMAAIWKKRFNTPLGAGTEEQFARAYRARVLPLYAA